MKEEIKLCVGDYVIHKQKTSNKLYLGVIEDITKDCMTVIDEVEVGPEMKVLSYRQSVEIWSHMNYTPQAEYTIVIPTQEQINARNFILNFQQNLRHYYNNRINLRQQ